MPPGPQPTASDLLLYALVVFVWGTSWIALSLQAGPVAPEVSVLWRFAVACPIMFAWAWLAGRRLAFEGREHLTFFGLGVTLFSNNLVLFYHASLWIPSGLMAVVFSLASIFNVALGALLLRQPLDGRVLLAGVIGTTGIALMFLPEITAHGFSWGAAYGLGFSVAATLSFCAGNIISSASQRRGVPVLSATAWGMLYGVGYLITLALVLGKSFRIEWTVVYLACLVWLAVVASVIAFASYLTLLGRIGPARAGYMTVLFPVVALAASTVFEGYTWTWAAAAGVALVIAGNVMVLRSGTRR